MAVEKLILLSFCQRCIYMLFCYILSGNTGHVRFITFRVALCIHMFLFYV